MTFVEFFGTVVKPKLIKGKGMISPLETGEINNRIKCIRDKDVNMFFYINSEDIIAIDCGYKSSENIESGLKKLGINGDDVRAIFLTHVDLDHAGGVDKRCKNLFCNAQIYLSSEEEKYLSNKYSRKKLLFFRLKTPIKLRGGYSVLEDKQTVTVGKTNVQSFLTPGHTLGHTSYMIDDKYLFVGDSLILNKTGGYCFYDFWNVDSKMNIRSLKSLKEIAHKADCELILTSHTGYTDDKSRAFAHISTVLDWRKKGFKFIDDAPDDLFV